MYVCVFVFVFVYVYVWRDLVSRTLPAYTLEHSFISWAVFIGNNLPQELIELRSNLCVFEKRIRYIVKYQALDIEFLVISLALYSRYKSYVLYSIQMWKLPQKSRKLESAKSETQDLFIPCWYLIKQLIHSLRLLDMSLC